ncbi:MAG TPA: DNA-binding response regulator [Coriobacteriia bacterium]|nr:DNA-binding response regulator [Coriobacteriia bacterium]
MKILLADDEPSIQTLVSQIIEDAGYGFHGIMDGREAVDATLRENPDLIILDVMMPGLDGFRVCNVLRDQGVLTPIIILSAKGDIVDKSIGFAAGADDYLVKPFSTDELLMRVQAHLRRHTRFDRAQSTHIRVRNLEIDISKHKLMKSGTEVSVTPKEFLILVHLAQHRGEIVTREQLIKEVWGDEFVCETSSVAVFIRKLREKIEADPSHPDLIKTVRNAGYIFSED